MTKGMMAKRINRRTLLRGLGGVAVALPVLECMLDRNGVRLAGAQGPGLPKRYGIVFAGQGIGGDEWARNEQRIRGEFYQEDGHFIAPGTFGAGYSLTTPLEPLADLKEHFSIVSRLAIPFNRNSTEGSDVPSAGAYREFHGGGCSPLLSGVRSTSSSFTCRGITSDQVLANAWQGATLFDSLVYRAQPSWYLSGSSYSGRQYISYRGDGDPIEAQVSPLVAYQSLFANFSPEEPEANAAFDLRKRARLSVLDLVSERREQVLTGLSSADRQRLEQHYDELRDLERRVDGATELGGGACGLPTNPGEDPAVGGDNAGSGSDSIATNTGYSNEHLRARLLADLVHMAMVCDLTRVFTLQLTTFQSHMNVYALTTDLGLPIRADLHEVGHNGDQDNRGQLAVSTCLKWHVGHYAYLVDKLRQTPEGDGTLLDNSTVVFTPEAGHGTQLDDAVSVNQGHSVEDMVMLVAGGASSLQLGQHIDGTGYHPAQGLLTAMKAAGYTGDEFGEVSGAIPGLLLT